MPTRTVILVAHDRATRRGPARHRSLERPGRAEGVRTLLRDGAEGGSPLLFGFLAGSVFPGRRGLRDAFALTLLALVADGLVLISVARRTYQRDQDAASTRTRR